MARCKPVVAPGQALSRLERDALGSTAATLLLRRTMTIVDVETGWIALGMAAKHLVQNGSKLTAQFSLSNVELNSALPKECSALRSPDFRAKLQPRDFAPPRKACFASEFVWIQTRAEHALERAWA